VNQSEVIAIVMSNHTKEELMNQNLESIPRGQLLNYIDQLRKFVAVKCEFPAHHARPKKKTNFLINLLQQPTATPGIGSGPRSSFVDLLEDDAKKGMQTYNCLRLPMALTHSSLIVFALPKYNLPVAKMGDYQSFIASQKTLRPIDEDTSLQRHNVFGSPYRLKVREPEEMARD
jgi:hypothetical protein